MAEAKTSAKGVTRGKAILIGVLSVVLLVILYVQFGGTSEVPDGAASKYRPPRPAVVVQPANDAAKPVTLATANAASTTSATAEKTAIATLNIDETRWKSPQLTVVVAYDPFALPPAFPQPPKVLTGSKSATGEALIAAANADDAKKLAEAMEQQRTDLEELTQRGVNVIMLDRNGYAAEIDDRIVHVGDEINGFTVTAIDPDGFVHVEKKESP